jgi:hypothetical protein
LVEQKSILRRLAAVAGHSALFIVVVAARRHRGRPLVELQRRAPAPTTIVVKNAQSVGG